MFLIRLQQRAALLGILGVLWIFPRLSESSCLRSSVPAPPKDFVDLSHWLDEDIPTWPDLQAFNMTSVDIHLGQSSMQSEVLVMSSHFGTHILAPSHAVEGMTSLDQIPSDDLYGPCYVINVEKHTREDPDYVINKTDVLYFEFHHGRIASRSVVLFNTGWAKKWTSPQDYLGTASSGDADRLSFPGICREAVELLDSRGVLGVGLDTAGLDPGRTRDLQAGVALASADMWGLVNLGSLDHMPPVGCTLYVLPLKLRNASGAPSSVVAFCDNSCRKDSVPRY